MRTRQIKLNGQTVDAVLVCGGAGFKVYTALGLDGWIIDRGAGIEFVSDDSPDARTVARYAALRYQPEEKQDAIKQAFIQLLDHDTALNKSKGDV